METLVATLSNELARIPLIDPHTHINPHAPASVSLNDILGYHYYTELAVSAGASKAAIESATGAEQASEILEWLTPCANTVQFSWLKTIAREHLGWEGEIDASHAQELFELANKRMSQPTWLDDVWRRSGLEALFLTNDFDDPLTGFETTRYVPCLRTDELVFKLDQASVRERLERSAGVSFSNIQDAVHRLFEHFCGHGARACAISLPPDFEPIRPGEREFDEALQRLGKGNVGNDDRMAVSYGIFYALADCCEEFELPFDLMIGVRRGVFESGVFQGQDLFDQRTSLYQYRRLFNDKSRVVFPISVLTHMQNQELVAYSWIFPNIVTSGHWWYSNIPAYIEPDLRARLEAVPLNKQIGYYSDAYKLEFVLPKFAMYRRCLARVLADLVVREGWSEEKAASAGRQLLRDNTERVFPPRR